MTCFASCADGAGAGVGAAVVAVVVVVCCSGDPHDTASNTRIAAILFISFLLAMRALHHRPTVAFSRSADRRSAADRFLSGRVSTLSRRAIPPCDGLACFVLR